MSRCSRPAAWTAATAWHSSMPMATASAGVKRLPCVEQLLERAPSTSSIQRPIAIADPLGAVDRDDVRVAHAGQQAALFDDRGRARPVGDRRGRQQLQRDLAVEPRVPGAVDLAEGAAADALEHAQVTPVVAGRRRAGQSRRCRSAHAARSFELIEQRAVGSSARRLDRGPVDRVAIEDGAGQIVDARFSSATLHLLGQPHQRPLRGLARRVRRRLAERLGELLVAVAQLDPADDRLALLRPQPLRAPARSARRASRPIASSSGESLASALECRRDRSNRAGVPCAGARRGSG